MSLFNREHLSFRFVRKNYDPKVRIDMVQDEWLGDLCDGHRVLREERCLAALEFSLDAMMVL